MQKAILKLKKRNLLQTLLKSFNKEKQTNKQSKYLDFNITTVLFGFIPALLMGLGPALLAGLIPTFLMGNLKKK